MRRREFLGALGGAVAVPFARPLAARAQQGERMRRIGVLLPSAADDAEFQARLAAFHQALALLGWTIGRNVRIDTRWATPNAADIRRHAAELAALAPDVILVHGAAAVGAMLQATRTVPIVFPVASDPVGAGFVDSLARPGGNVTGFMSFEYSLAGKRLELLKQIAPGVMRAAVLRDPTQGGGTSEFAVIQTVALEAKRQGLLRELLPQARAIAALVDPNAPDSATQLKNVQDAARTFDREIQIVQASTASQLDNGFAILASQRADALSRPLDPQGAGEHQPIRLRVRLSLRAGYSGDREVVVWCRRPDVTGATMPPLRSFRPRQAIQVRTSSAQRRSLADSDV